MCARNAPTGPVPRNPASTASTTVQRSTACNARTATTATPPANAAFVFVEAGMMWALYRTRLAFSFVDVRFVDRQCRYSNLRHSKLSRSSMNGLPPPEYGRSTLSASIRRLTFWKFSIVPVGCSNSLRNAIDKTSLASDGNEFSITSDSIILKLNQPRPYKPAAPVHREDGERASTVRCRS